MNRVSPGFARLVGVALAGVAVACSSDDGAGQSRGGAGSGGASGGGPSSGANSGGSVAQGGKSGGGGKTAGDGGQSAAGNGNEGGGVSGGGRPAGWLYTEGNKIFESDGKGAGTPWMGRGMNIDDIFFCGYNGSLWMESPGAEMKTIVSKVMSDWKPNFFRTSLAMASFAKTVSFSENVDEYQKPMVDAIKAMGSYAGVHVLVVLRSDASMIGHFPGGPEPTGSPSDGASTPDKSKFPNGTDDVYKALVNSFKDDAFVMFGLSNEPGGNALPNEQIHAAMNHAVGVIRAEEARLGVPHHLVAVQGQGWTGDVSYYADHALMHDDVVYEVHGYPPPPSAYTYANLPIVIGEYGSIDAAAFFADVEQKQIPNLAWDMDPYSNCAPDLVEVNQSSSNLVPTEWGKTVQAYLLDHAD
jgi:hypothetical protein